MPVVKTSPYALCLLFLRAFPADFHGVSFLGEGFFSLWVVFGTKELRRNDLDLGGNVALLLGAA